MKNMIKCAAIAVGLIIFTQAQSAQLSAIIIGSGSPMINENRAGASVLISLGEMRIMIDMGNGT